MESFDVRIYDMISLENLLKALVLNKYSVTTKAVYKLYPENNNIDYFLVTIRKECEKENS
jgi:hypothetical protein